MSSLDKNFYTPQYILTKPRASTRLAWLLIGLAVGYIASNLQLSTIILFLAIAATAGISGNWTS